MELLPVLSLAVKSASTHNAGAIYVGLRVGPGTDELAQASEFVQIWSELIQLPCGLADVELQTPLLELEPWQVVDVGFNVSAPFERTWSCLEQTAEPCWSCRGCRMREAAFQQAGKPDPLRGEEGLAKAVFGPKIQWSMIHRHLNHQEFTAAAIDDIIGAESGPIGRNYAER